MSLSLPRPTFHFAPQPNRAFNADVHASHGRRLTYELCLSSFAFNEKSINDH
jgi:hypothetical protein